MPLRRPGSLLKFHGIFAVALVLGLAACSEESSEQKASEPAAKTEILRARPHRLRRPQPPSQPAPARAEAPAAPAAPADDGAGAMDGAPEAGPADDGAGAMAGAPQATPGKDEQACLQAVFPQTNNGEVVTLSVEIV